VKARPAYRALLALGALGAVLGLTFVDAARIRRARRDERLATARFAAQAGLTDLALFNEARYTRHPSQADRHAAFQDQPLAFDLFPTGSLLPPRSHAHLD
jgi:hypothetical protein